MNTLSPSLRIANTAAVLDGPYGAVTRQASLSATSRQALYRDAPRLIQAERKRAASPFPHPIPKRNELRPLFPFPPVSAIDPSGLLWYPGKYLWDLYSQTKQSQSLDAKINSLPVNADKAPVSTTASFSVTAGTAIREGVTDGAVMVYNAATFHQHAAANDYVNKAIAENGGTYQTANFFAHVGAWAGEAAAAFGVLQAFAGGTFSMSFSFQGGWIPHTIFQSSASPIWYHAMGPWGNMIIMGAGTAFYGAARWWNTIVLPALNPGVVSGYVDKSTGAWTCFTAALGAYLRTFCK